MSATPRTANPFYFVLKVVGVLFTLTACAYAVMTVKGIDPAAAAESGQVDNPLVVFLQEYGFAVLMIELGLLALATLAAIGTDEYWLRRARRQGPAGQDGGAPEDGAEP